MTLTLKYADREYVAMTVEQLLDAGVPEAIIDAARVDQRLVAIKAECRRRIYAVASAETQMNMASMATIIGAKTASTRTEAEKAALSAFGMSLEWVQAMRAAVTTITADPTVDIAPDQTWPPCPTEVVDLAKSF